MKQISYIVVISFLLFIFGFLGLSFLTGFGLTQYWEQKMQIIVELRDDIQENDLDELQNALESSPFVNVNSLDIVTKDDAAALMRNEFGEEFLTAEIENPLRNVFIFNLNQGYNDEANLDKIKQSLLQYKAVAEVDYEKNRSQNVINDLKKLRFLGILFFLMLLFILIYVVRQHTLSAWQADKTTIWEQEDRETALIIAKKETLGRNLKNSFWATAIAITWLIGYNYWFNSNFPDFTSFINNNWVVGLFVFILVTTLLLTYLVTFFLQKQQKIDVY
jgi:cell division transport system permease protein